MGVPLDARRAKPDRDLRLCTDGLSASLSLLLRTRRRPGEATGPVEVAALAGKLSAETVNALANEASGPVGRLLGIPVDGADATVEGLKADIKNAAGRVALLETGDWGNAGGDAKVDLKAERFGAEPPASLVDLVDVSSREIYAALRLQRGPMGRLSGGLSPGSMAAGPIRCPITPGAAGASRAARQA